MPANATLTVNLQASPTVAGGAAAGPPQMPTAPRPTMADFMTRPAGFGAFTTREIMAGFMQAPPAAAKGFDPFEEARQRREAELRSNSVNDAYNKLFPKPPPSVWQQLFSPPAEQRQSAAFASMGLGIAGFHGAAAVAGGFAGAGPAGAAVAAINQFGSKLNDVNRQVLSPLVSLDYHALERGMAGLVENVPVLGGLLSKLTSSVLDFSDAIIRGGQHLSAYSPELAMTFALQEISNIERDLRRAQEFGPQIATAIQERFDFQNEIQTLMDRHLGDILELQRAGIEFLKMLEPILGTVVTVAAEMSRRGWIQAGLIALENILLPGQAGQNMTNALLGQILRQLRQEEQLNHNLFLDQFFESQSGMGPTGPRGFRGTPLEQM